MSKEIIVPDLHPKVKDAVSSMLTECNERKISCGVQCGIRTAEQSERLYALGRTVVNPTGKTIDRPMGITVSNARAWESPHNFGLAVDIVFKTPKGDWTWNVSTKKWLELSEIGKIFGFSWGGDWKKFKDYPHFEMKGKIPSWKAAKSILFEKGLDAVWALV